MITITVWVLIVNYGGAIQPKIYTVPGLSSEKECHLLGDALNPPGFGDFKCYSYTTTNARQQRWD